MVKLFNRCASGLRRKSCAAHWPVTYRFGGYSSRYPSRFSGFNCRSPERFLSRSHGDDSVPFRRGPVQAMEPVAESGTSNRNHGIFSSGTEQRTANDNSGSESHFRSIMRDYHGDDNTITPRTSSSTTPNQQTPVLDPIDGMPDSEQAFENSFFPPSSSPKVDVSMAPKKVDAITSGVQTNETRKSTPRVSQINGGARERRKVDLSHVNLRDREAAASQGRHDTGSKHSTSFRANSGLRQVLFTFMARISHDALDGDLDQPLKFVFNPKSWDVLQRNEYRPEDVLSWSWIFSTRSPTRQIARYVALCQDCRHEGLPQPPSFIPLQLLRLEHINGPSLRILWQEVADNVENQRNFPAWDDDSAAILLIRALRHARRVDISLCKEIVSVAPKVLPQRFNDLAPEQALFHAQRLTHFYNRILTLLALPTPQQPFRSVPIQQQAQLDVARFMYASQPPIVVNREGYRAFVQLQLRHAKTNDEQEWARAKSPAWPPWRRDQLGIQASIDYPGRHSRVMKVLQRMRESGYGPSDFEDTAQILAGWDTDRSPTIQVRRLMNARPMTWLRKLVSKNDISNETIDHNTWAARVEATRSIREAWLCFHTYMEQTTRIKRDHVVYNAMFQKLLARPMSNESTSSGLPGDGREVFADPISTRDLVYVPSDPPTIEELYSQMLGDGIKPAGRLLANLLRSASSNDLVIQYIGDSSLSELKRDVLLHAEKYPHTVISSTLQQLPGYLLASIITALARSNNDKKLGTVFKKPGSLSANPHHAHFMNVSPLTYARQLLEITGSNYLPAYHALLTGLQYRANTLRYSDPDNEHPASSARAHLWDTVLRVLELMNKQQISPDHRVVHIVATTAQHVVARVGDTSSGRLLPLHSVSAVIKCLFWFTLIGRTISEHDWKQREHFHRLRVIPAKSVVSGTIPTFKEVQTLFLAFSSCRDHDAIMSLIAWVDEGSRHGMFSTGRPHAKTQMLAAMRLAVERISDGNMNASHNFGTEAIALSESLGWATDEELEDFVSRGYPG